MATPSGKGTRKTKQAEDTPGGKSVTSTGSTSRGVPDNVKKQFADDVEETAGLRSFGKGKPFTLATDIFAKSDTYDDHRRGCENLFSVWSRYSDKEYKKKVLDRWGFLTFQERRKKQESSTGKKTGRKTRSSVRKQLSFDWSSPSEDEDEEISINGCPLEFFVDCSKHFWMTSKVAAKPTMIRLAFSLVNTTNGPSHEDQTIL